MEMDMEYEMNTNEIDMNILMDNAEDMLQKIREIEVADQEIQELVSLPLFRGFCSDGVEEILSRKIFPDDCDDIQEVEIEREENVHVHVQMQVQMQLKKFPGLSSSNIADAAIPPNMLLQVIPLSELRILNLDFVYPIDSIPDFSYLFQY